MSKLSIAKQMSVLEADFTKVLSPGSIKSAMKTAGAGSRDLWQVPPSQLKVIEGLNPRVVNESYKQHIRALADSIKSEGFYQHKPLGGYVSEEDGVEQIYIYEGGSRLAAATKPRTTGRRR